MAKLIEDPKKLDETLKKLSGNKVAESKGQHPNGLIQMVVLFFTAGKTTIITIWGMVGAISGWQIREKEGPPQGTFPAKKK